MKLLTERVIGLSDNRKKVVKLALVYLSKDLIAFRKKFERQVIEVQVKGAIEVLSCVFLKLIKLGKCLNSLFLLAEHGKKWLELRSEGDVREDVNKAIGLKRQVDVVLVGVALDILFDMMGSRG